MKTEAHLSDPLDAPCDRQLAEAIAREHPRLRNFIRRRVVDPSDVEDILQDVFYELTLAYHLYKPVEHTAAWLYRVARNRIIDLFRKSKTKPQSLADSVATSDDGDALHLEDLLPSHDAGPEAVFARTLLLEEFADALNELPAISATSSSPTNSKAAASRTSPPRTASASTRCSPASTPPCFICAAGCSRSTTISRKVRYRQMRAKRLVAIGFGSAIVLLIVIAGFGQAVLQLWNWLVPDLFGLRPSRSGRP